LESQAASRPDGIAFSFLRDIKGDVFDDDLTYGQLRDSAQDIAEWLRVRGHGPGERALLVFSPGLEFTRAFFGCAYAGLIAVPAPPPGGSRASIERLDGILASARPAMIITDDRALPDVTEWLSERSDDHPPCVSIQRMEPAAGGGRRAPARSPDALAVLQFTSGSTSTPKGVEITHRNLLSNLNLIHAHVGAGEDLRGCGWLPLTHDMGLIGQFLYPLFVGGWCLMLPPLEFVRRPARWLALISEHGVTHTCTPNFAYELCARKVTDEQVAGLDLSRWRVALNGAEPLQAATMEAFAKRMSPAGFRLETFLPCYGLAEATLLVAGKLNGEPLVTTSVDAAQLAARRLVPGSPDDRAATLVSSGQVLRGNVLIVEPATGVPLGDRRVGEIWVSGECVARGYWEDEEATGESFGFRTSDGRGPFLRTGDLGARDGAELYVVGRIKDVIVVHGRNVYPHDLERAAQDQAGDLVFMSTAAFGLDGEHIVLIQEVRPPRGADAALAEGASRIRRELSRRAGTGKISIVFVRPGAVRKTTSGKVSRSAMRRLFTESGLTPVYQSLSGELSAGSTGR
jgi:acyl-CoA synthetase (AMP-forming)/AMP-acid ligase II